MLGWIICHWIDLFCRKPKITRADVERQRIINNTPKWANDKANEIMEDIRFLEQAGWDLESFYNRKKKRAR